MYVTVLMCSLIAYVCDRINVSLIYCVVTTGSLIILCTATLNCYDLVNSELTKTDQLSYKYII